MGRIRSVVQRPKRGRIVRSYKGQNEPDSFGRKEAKARLDRSAVRRPKRGRIRSALRRPKRDRVRSALGRPGWATLIRPYGGKVGPSSFGHRCCGRTGSLTPIDVERRPRLKAQLQTAPVSMGARRTEPRQAARIARKAAGSALHRPCAARHSIWNNPSRICAEASRSRISGSMRGSSRP